MELFHCDGNPLFKGGQRMIEKLDPLGITVNDLGQAIILYRPLGTTKKSGINQNGYPLFRPIGPNGATSFFHFVQNLHPISQRFKKTIYPVVALNLALRFIKPLAIKGRLLNQCHLLD